MEHDHRLTTAAIEIIETSLAGMHITVTQLSPPPPEFAAILCDIMVIRTEVERAAKRSPHRLNATEFTNIHVSLRRLREKVLPLTCQRRIIDGILNIDYVLESTYAAEYEAERKRMGLLSVWRAGHVELDEVAFRGIRRMVYQPSPIPLAAGPPAHKRTPTANRLPNTPLELSVEIGDACVTWRQLWNYAEQLLSCTPRAVIEAIQPTSEDPNTLALKIES